MAVRPAFEVWDTPDSYKDPDEWRGSYPGSDKLPDKMKVWLVQTIGKKGTGAVARGEYFFGDSPGVDAEILALGFNSTKNYGEVGIGRHGNFLLWGYSGSPTQMTEPGRRLFLNCICYIHRFDGKAPLVRLDASLRSDASGMAVAGVKNVDPKQLFLEFFPESLYEKYFSDREALARYYKENREWVYQDRVFRVDEELKGLGLDSNRTIASLQRLIGLLDDPQRGPLAKALLQRYTECSFETSPPWRQWLEENKDRLYFSDVGGYKFRVVPPGYSPAAAAKK